MNMLRFCRYLAAFLACLLLVVFLFVRPVIAQESEDSQLFLSGFNAYQQKDFSKAASLLNEVLKKYPDTPLRDMTLFWLARSHYKVGNRDDAARYMVLFTSEYPDNPLKNTVEDDLLSLASAYEKKHGGAESIVAQVKVDEENRRAEAEAERVAREKAEAARLASARIEAERVAQQKAALEAEEKARMAAAKAEAERIAGVKAEAERQALQKSVQEAELKEQIEVARIEEVKKAEAVRLEEQRKNAVAEAEKQKIADNERKAREKAEADRLARLKSDQERLAAAKADEQRRLGESAALAEKIQQQQKLAELKRVEENRISAEKLKQERLALKEKAIAEYKSVLDRFPGSNAANVAAARLKDMGVAVALSPPAKPKSVSTAAVTETSGTSQVLTLEVAQYAAFEFDLKQSANPVDVARRTAIPFEIQNRGNGHDSFYLASSFPDEFGVRFTAAATPELSINQTPLLAAGERFKGLVLLSVPPSSIDGLKIAYPVKAASQFMGEASQSRVVSLIAAAPLLRALVKTDKLQILPGEKLQYRVTVLNVGSTTAEDVTLRLNFPAQYQPVDFATAGFRQEMNAALVMDGITLKSGESRDLAVSFQLKEEALAKEELMIRADVINNSLQTRGTYLSNTTFVLPVSMLALKMGQEQVTAVPGQTVTIPARIINRGNQRERISLVALAAPFQKAAIYHDINRDGLRQPGEPEVTTIGPLGPKEEAALLLEIVTPKNAPDGAVEKISLTAAPETSQNKLVTADSRVIYSRPLLQLAMKGREGRMVPGELLTVELDVLNRGSNLAKLVNLEVTWPDQVELVAADQSADKTQSGIAVWRFNELGAGEKRLIKASFRIKSGTVVGTGVQLKSVLNYQDHAGNRY